MFPYNKKITNGFTRIQLEDLKHCLRRSNPPETIHRSWFRCHQPVPCSAAGMDPEHLKNTYGDR
jgi:hypothetical protein